MVVAALLAGVLGILGPWWSFQEASFGHFGQYTGTLDWGLVSSTYSPPPIGTPPRTSNYTNLPHIGGVLSGAAVLSVLSLGFGGGLILTMVPAWRRDWFRFLGLALGAAGGAADFVAAFYVMSALPGAAETDLRTITSFVSITSFWGSGSGGNFDFHIDLVWGPGWAWYAAVVAGILLVLAGIARWRGWVLPSRRTGSPSTERSEAPPRQRP
ncbi:MAG TPA: hypothetical protein HA326_02965 [Thermoplasmata archaeon]|nr:hypothetical protein [Thermoplasmata archaeon]